MIRWPVLLGAAFGLLWYQCECGGHSVPHELRWPDVSGATDADWYHLWIALGGSEEAWSALDMYGKARVKYDLRTTLAHLKSEVGRARATPRKTFIIVTTQRTGSTWLATRATAGCFTCT